MFPFVIRELVRNRRRTITSIVGVILGTGLLSGVLFFIDASGATMTTRAVAELPLDMQVLLSDSFGRRVDFTERFSAPGLLMAGRTATFTLTVRNRTTQAVHEVVIADEPPPPLSYVDGSTTVNGRRIADIAGRSPLAQGLARTGFNFGTLETGTTLTVTYEARANTAFNVNGLRMEGTVSSRENVVRVRANTPHPPTLNQLSDRIGRIPGIASTDELSMVDLASPAVTFGGVQLEGRVRVVGVDIDYPKHNPSVRIVDGSFRSDGVVVSSEMSRSLGVTIGKPIKVSIPGRAAPLPLRVTGIADLSNAQQLFMSRKASKLEDVLYLPFSVVVPLAVFSREIVPAFQRASAVPGAALKNTPLSEVGVRLARPLLRSAPASALAQTTLIAQEIQRVNADDTSLIDNISNALTVAADDAKTGRRMFLFLGIPGVLLAFALVLFGANIQAESQRREHATFRLHGADRAMLLRMVVVRTLTFAGVGALIGLVLGLGAVGLVLGTDAVLEIPFRRTATSALIAIATSVVVAVVALAARDWRASAREIASERGELSVAIRPVWHRRCIDVVLVAIAVLAVARNAITSPPGRVSVSAGQAASIPLEALVAPMAVWLGGAFLFGRGVHAAVGCLRRPDGRAFGSLVRGSLRRTFWRRSWPLVNATIGICLVVTFATNLGVFTSTYYRTKSADSRFAVGADLRITPDETDGPAHGLPLARRLTVEGVQAVTPIIASLENSVLIGPYDQARTDLAAIDPSSFRRAAELSESTFVGVSADTALESLLRDPAGVLISAARADDLSIGVGDRVQVLLARGSKHQRLRTFRVVGLFKAFPGFPQGLDIVVDVAAYRSATGSDGVDFFLARTAEGRGSATASATVRMTTRATGDGRSLRVVTPATYLNKDQSSLTAVNVRGLLELGTAFALAIGVAAVLIVVFGQLLERRKEYVTLRAFGMSTSSMAALILGESLFVTVNGLVGGLAMGLVMARVFVNVLQPIFLVVPHFAVPVRFLARFCAALVVSTVAFALCATALVTGRRAVGILREP